MIHPMPENMTTPEQVNQPPRKAPRKRGRPPLQDEFTARPISRQRKWQLRKQAAGRCKLCGRLAVTSSGYCMKHFINNRNYSAERFGYKTTYSNCKSRRLEALFQAKTDIWEYQTVSAREAGVLEDRLALDHHLQECGHHGWELTGVAHKNDGDVWFFFKRRKNDAAKSGQTKPLDTAPLLPLTAPPAGPADMACG
jgi:hypothetical protein